jgi:hypothetical protein
MNGLEIQSMKNIGLKEKIKIEKLDKKNEQIKFISSLLISNLFVFFIAQNFYSKETESPKIGKSKIHHPKHQEISVFLRSLIPINELNNSEEKTYSLLDQNEKIMIEKVYMLEAITSKSSDIENEKTIEARIEIPNDTIEKLSSIQNKKLILVPYIQQSIAFKKNNQPKVESQYEIHF